MGPEEIIIYFCHDNTLRSKTEKQRERENISKKVTTWVSTLVSPTLSS